MKKLLIVSAITLPLAGCGWLMDLNVFESYKQWCEETWGPGWPCTVEYARDGRTDFLKPDHDSNDHDSNDREEHESNGGEGEGEGEGGEGEGEGSPE